MLNFKWSTSICIYSLTRYTKPEKCNFIIKRAWYTQHFYLVVECPYNITCAERLTIFFFISCRRTERMLKKKMMMMAYLRWLYEDGWTCTKRKLRTMRVSNKPKHSMALCMGKIKLSPFVFLMDFIVYMGRTQGISTKRIKMSSFGKWRCENNSEKNNENQTYYAHGAIRYS